MFIVPKENDKPSKAGIDKKEFVFAVAIISSLAASFVYDKWIAE